MVSMVIQGGADDLISDGEAQPVETSPEIQADTQPVEERYGRKGTTGA